MISKEFQEYLDDIKKFIVINVVNNELFINKQNFKYITIVDYYGEFEINIEQLRLNSDDAKSCAWELDMANIIVNKLNAFLLPKKEQTDAMNIEPEIYYEKIRKVFTGKFIIQDTDLSHKINTKRPDLNLTIKGYDLKEIDPLVILATNKK